MRSQGKLMPLKVETRGQIQRITTYWMEQKLQSRSSFGNQCLDKEACTVTVNYWKFSMNKSESNSLYGAPVILHGAPFILLWILPLGAWLDSLKWLWEKNTGKGEEKEFWNMPKHFVLLNKVCPLEKLIDQIFLGFYQKLPDLREGKYPTAVSSNLLCAREETLIINSAHSNHLVPNW